MSTRTETRNSPEIVRAIENFVEAPEPARFEDLVGRAFAFQRQRIPALERLVERRGGTRTESWRDVPAVPVQAFKTLRLAAAPALEVFRSSGTTGTRSEHHHPFPDLYRRIVDRSFPRSCPLPVGAPILSLVPPRTLAADSSLGFMVDHLVRSRGGSTSRWAFGRTGVDVDAATEWARSEAARGEPVLVFATAFALVEWLDGLPAPLELPDGSVVLETGGFKGRVREISRPDLVGRIGERLRVPPERVLREYGMCELTSQLYSSNLLGGHAELLVGPEWVRASVLDPRTLQESREGEVGLISILDLGNVGSVLRILTQDLGVLEPDGLRLVGRASGAELRGCSLTVEEMTDGR